MSRTPTKILLIEDHPGDARLIELLLGEVRGSAFEILHADRLASGLARCQVEDVDIIFLDLSLPDSAGLDTFLKVHAQIPNVPILVLTGFADEDLAIRAVREGAQDYIVKGELDGNLLARACRYAIERHRAEQALRESEERYALAIQGANDGLWDWDLLTNRIYFSPRWLLMLQLEDGEIDNTPEDWFSRIFHEDWPQFELDLNTHLEGLSPHFENEHRMKHRDGTFRWMLSRGLAVRDSHGKAYRMAGSLSDITDRKQAEEQLRHDAFFDRISKLPNRALFLDRLGRAIEREKRKSENRFALLYMDLDRFKQVNDGMGHAAGDELLYRISRRLETCVRASDTVARLGGDEFAMLIEEIDGNHEALDIAQRVKKVLRAPFVMETRDIFLSTSIGIVQSDESYTRPEDALRDSEIAMYRAKSSGGDCHVVYESRMRPQAANRLWAEGELRRAIDRREFRLYYQPIISFKTGALAGFEALLRWEHPDRGLLSPLEFIALAEETGLIIPIGHWVIAEACRQLAAWQVQFPSPGDLMISVNLSTKQFREADLVDHIRRSLEIAGLSPHQLRLEITESLLMELTDKTLEILSRMHALGVQVYIDDFGTGYSSLSYLHRLPIDALKIDRSFVARIGQEGNHAEIVQTILSLARDLGLIAIAEGIETQEQLVKLRDLDCDFAQGFLISKPFPPEEAKAIFAGNPLQEFVPETLAERS